MTGDGSPADPEPAATAQAVAGAGLKLRAEDEEDLAILSACLQDSLVTVADMAYLPEDRQFVFVANRFRWEVDGRMTGNMRINCGMVFDGVTAVKLRGIERRNPGRILSLLTLASADGIVLIQFADDCAVRLEVERLQCRLEDFGEPWPSLWRPRHALEN